MYIYICIALICARGRSPKPWGRELCEPEFRHLSAQLLRKFCGDWRRLSFSAVKRPTSIAEICGDDESAQKVCIQYSYCKYYIYIEREIYIYIYSMYIYIYIYIYICIGLASPEAAFSLLFVAGASRCPLLGAPSL